METTARISTRLLLCLLLIGAVPAVVAMLSAAEVLRLWDLPVAASVLIGGLLLVRQKWGPADGKIPFPLPLSLALLILLVPTLYVHATLPAPVSNDEVSYLRQAEIFADGHLSEPLPAQPLVAFSQRQRQMHEDPQRGVRYSKYPPGTAAALLPGVLVGWPALPVALAGVIDLLLMWRLALRLRLPRPRQAALLLAVSPFFLLVQSSFQSEVFTLPAALAGYLALLHCRDAADARRAALWGGVVGACCGLIFLCRPLTGVVAAVAFGFGMLLQRRPAQDRTVPPPAGLDEAAAAERGSAGVAPRLVAVAAAVLGGGGFLWLALAYNHAQTGAWLDSPYTAYAQAFGPWHNPGAPAAERQPIDVYGQGDILAGLGRQAARWSVSLGGMLGAWLLAYWGLWRQRRADGGAAFLFALLLPLAYAFHWYPGHWAYLGPLYCFESLGLLLLGFLALARDMPPRWSRGLLLAMLSWGVLHYVIRLNEVRDHSELRAAPQLVAAQMENHSVLLLPYLAHPLLHEPTLKNWSPSPHPGMERVAILRELDTPAKTSRLLRELGLDDRSVYRLSPLDQRDDQGLLYEALPLD